MLFFQRGRGAVWYPLPMCAHRLTIFFISRAGATRRRCLRKKKRPEQCRYGKYPHCSGLSGGVQPRWSVSNVIFCGPAVVAAVIASSSACPDRQGTCSCISRIRPILSLFRARRKESPRFHTMGISGDTSSRSRFCPPISFRKFRRFA